MSLSKVAAWLVRFEVPVLCVVYACFVISDSFPLVGILLIGLCWAGRAVTTRRLTRRTRFDLPIVILLCLMPVALRVSAYPWLSLPKTYGVILGAVSFYAVVNQVATRRDLASAVFWLVLTCVAISVAGLVGTDWAQSKIISASFIYDRLPHVIQAIPRSIAGGFARNGVGGTLTFVVPLLACLLFAPRVIVAPVVASAVPADVTPASSAHFGVWLERTTDRARNLERWFPYLVWFALGLAVLALALTQSRGAILGTAVALLGVAIWRERRFSWLILVLALLFVGLLLAGQGNASAEFLLRMDAQNGTLASRLEVWQRGVMMVQDFPFTGIGIGTFNEVAHSLYPFFIAAPDEVVAHAHNNLLEVAVDVGIPGLVAYSAMLTAFAVCALRAYADTADPGLRALIAGLALGVLANQVFGLTDAFILGTKPGVLLWVFFALIAVVYSHRHEWRAAGAS